MTSQAVLPPWIREARTHLEEAYRYYEPSRDYARVLAECDAAIASDPALAEAHCLRGLALEGLNRPAEAIVAYQEAARIDPRLKEPQENLARLAEAHYADHRTIPGVAERNYPTIGTGPAGPSATVDPRPLFQFKLRRELRTWAFWLGAIGLLQFIVAQLSNTWGVLLLLVAGMSLLVSNTAMFVLYAVIMGWAGVHNLQSSQPAWIGFALLQAYLCYRIVGQYRTFRAWETRLAVPAEQQAGLAPGPGLISTAFPAAGCVASAVAAAAFFGSFLLMVALGRSAAPATTSAATWTMEMGINLAVLGLGLTLAALLGHFRWKTVAILGLAGSVFVLVAELAVWLALRS